jgi:hypothetical protein
LQQCKSGHGIPRELSRLPSGDSDFRRMIMRKLAREPAQNARFELPLTVSIVSPDAV